MNNWTKLSIEYANQRNYLDELFKVYPTIPEGIRDIDKQKWKAIENAYKTKNKVELLKLLLSLDLFPIKDSYVAYLKRDSSAISRNPATRLPPSIRPAGTTTDSGERNNFPSSERNRVCATNFWGNAENPLNTRIMPFALPSLADVPVAGNNLVNDFSSVRVSAGIVCSPSADSIPSRAVICALAVISLVFGQTLTWALAKKNWSAKTPPIPVVKTRNNTKNRILLELLFKAREGSVAEGITSSGSCFFPLEGGRMSRTFFVCICKFFTGHKARKIMG